MHLDETLGVPSRLEPSHSLLPLPRRLMRVLGPVVSITMLSMSNAGHHDPFCGPVATQFVRNDHTRWMPNHVQQLAKETHGGESIPLGLDKNVEHNTVLIDSSPEVVRNAVDFEEDIIQMPFLPSPETLSPQTGSILFA